MTQRTNAAELEPLVSREQGENAFRDAMRLYVGRRCRYSVEQLAKGIGCKPKAIYDFISYPSGHPDHRPLHLGLVISITRFLGADFTCEWLKLADQGAFDLPDDETPPGMRMAIDSTTDSAKLLNIVADEEIDEDERDDAAAIGRRKITRGMALVAIARRAAA